MNDHFADLAPSGDPTGGVQRFYGTVGRLGTLDHVTRVAAEADVLAVRAGR